MPKQPWIKWDIDRERDHIYGILYPGHGHKRYSLNVLGTRIAYRNPDDPTSHYNPGWDLVITSGTYKLRDGQYDWAIHTSIVLNNDGSTDGRYDAIPLAERAAYEWLREHDANT